MQTATNEIKICEVCGNTKLISVLNLGFQPMCDDLVPIGDSRICNQYPIEILYCVECCTAHQRFQIPKEKLFPRTYHYRARFTADVLDGMAELVNACQQRLGTLAGKTVLDIGCNDGSLLDYFREYNAMTIGIEPTDACHEASQKGHTTFNRFFDKYVALEIVKSIGKPDLVTFTNVFAHIENLQDVIDSLKILMSPSTVIVIENHYLGAVLERYQFDTFYHEHPRTYSCTSFEYIARSLGVELLEVEFPSRYGGNIRVFLGNIGNYEQKKTFNLNEIKYKEKEFYPAFINMENKIRQWCMAKKTILADTVRKHGKLKAKAFPGRASILVKLLDLNEELVYAVYEKPGSMKIGHYVPGTRIPIYSDEELFQLPDKTASLLNFAWHISREISDYLKTNGYTGQMIDILNIEDFDTGRK
jgi:hypothetical protein